ncbi:GNAT family N-acetyltransferase [uncultured Xylophilus sp.]|uniref:GNAT family N-acetyltransferase n=1 Tax=uncultured Xylophilus sp. TaxID=296832 RepID=UPI0025D350BA|nr:GNAT family N-acetyltransferase [uncultured Xylophilus sp.]
MHPDSPSPTGGTEIRWAEIGGERYAVRDLTPDDTSAMLALHRRVFGADSDTSWFDWKYQAGGAVGVAMWRGDEMVAHGAGLPRPLWHRGVRTTGMQVGDVMTAPEYRGILTRQGPFFHTTKMLYESKLGPAPKIAIGYGFPSERHMRLGAALRLGWDRGPIHGLSWPAADPAQPAPALRWWRWEPLDAAAPGFDAAIQGAWDAMRPEAAAMGLTLGERSPAYLRWRFCDRPDKAYRFFALRRPWSRTVRGIAVTEIPAAGRPMMWLDWVGPLRLMALATLACRREAGRAGASGMTAWATPAVREHLAATGLSDVTETARLGVPVASDVQADAVAGFRWWFMGGDTDFL